LEACFIIMCALNNLFFPCPQSQKSAPHAASNSDPFHPETKAAGPGKKTNN
jgi:hypothetical protein